MTHEKRLWKLERNGVCESVPAAPFILSAWKRPLKMNEIQDLDTVKHTTAVWLSRKELRSTCGFTGVFSIHLWHKHTHSLTHTHWNSPTQAKPQRTKSSYAPSGLKFEAEWEYVSPSRSFRRAPSLNSKIYLRFSSATCYFLYKLSQDYWYQWLFVCVFRDLQYTRWVRADSDITKH